ncbi:3-dehydroquinate synthase [Psychroflexus sp. MBR-150]|jgi:3-dehydroquinate synthase
MIDDKSILFEKKAYKTLDTLVKTASVSSVFLLIDNNTKTHCLDHFKNRVSFNFKTVLIPFGEMHKNLETCSVIWQNLSDNGADRQSLLINLGGGVITDIGGFTASCFRRGIAFVHIPTTLLGMIDAAIGGKNGVDFKNLKNQIGVIKQPEMILIDQVFLKTLPHNQMVSGFAEMIKHGLINVKSHTYFDKCLDLEKVDSENIKDLVEESIKIKKMIVDADTSEKGIRKILNYGHTLGHAIESYRLSLDPTKHLLHGEAIAIGLVLETFISHKMFGYPKRVLNQLKSLVKRFYISQNFGRDEISQIIDLMKYDKKNIKGKVNFVLLKNIGQYVLDCQVENKLIYEAFDFYAKD